jgi:hypothetical protein
MALAATQTTSLLTCIDSTGNPLDGIDYNGQLKATPDQIPIDSGVINGSQAYTPLSLGPDGQRVLCAIGMMSGPNPKFWQKNLLW